MEKNCLVKWLNRKPIAEGWREIIYDCICRLTNLASLELFADHYLHVRRDYHFAHQGVESYLI